MTVSHSTTIAIPQSLWRWSVALLLLCGIGLSGSANRVGVGSHFTGVSSAKESTTFRFLGHHQTAVAAKRIFSFDEKNSGDEETSSALPGYHSLLARLSVENVGIPSNDLLDVAIPYFHLSLKTPRAPPFSA